MIFRVLINYCPVQGEHKPGKRQFVGICILNYNCQSLLYLLEMFDMCAVGNSVHIILMCSSIQFFISFYTYSLSYITKKTKLNSVALVASELYRPSDRSMSAKLVPTFADRGCRMGIATDPHGRILGFLDRSRYYKVRQDNFLF
jgi:hypothetical protein